MSRRRLAAWVLPVALVLGGCGDTDDEPETSTGGEAPSSATPSSATPTAESSAPVEPSVAPATGPLITGPIVSINAPAGFREPLDSPLGGVSGGTDPSYAVTLSDNQGDSFESLDAEARETRESGLYDSLERQDDITIAGQPAYRLAGPDTAFPTWIEVYGFGYQDHTIQISIATPLRQAQAKRDAFAAPILASVTLLE